GDPAGGRLMTSRRGLLRGALTSLAGLTVAGCEETARSPQVNGVLDAGEELSRRAQRMILGRGALAREVARSAISPDFRADGATKPDSDEYQAIASTGFSDWKLQIGGLVERPMSLSLAELRKWPSRTQITRHDCVEGWSSIAEWTGAKLGPLLKAAAL